MRGVFVVVFLLTVLAGCATAPSQITNACAIFEQRNGMFNNWKKMRRRQSVSSACRCRL